MGGEAARGRERRKRTQQTALLIHHLWQRPFPLHEATLKAGSSDPWYMVHTDYLQSNYSNTIFWLVSLLEVIFFHSPLFFKSPVRESAAMGKHLFIAKIIWHQQRAEIFPMSQEGPCPVGTPFKWK